MTTTHTPSPHPPQELDQYQGWEERKEEEVITVRLENIKLQNKIAKLEALIKEKVCSVCVCHLLMSGGCVQEQLAEGLHMIDFEQLKINNVDLNEKIEERNEDILKLRRKVTSTVQVLTHVKEKLQFLQVSPHNITPSPLEPAPSGRECGEEEQTQRNGQCSSKGNHIVCVCVCVCVCVQLDTLLLQSRDHLTRMKQARDSLRMDNNRLKQRGGLVGHKALLRDYEERKDQVCLYSDCTVSLVHVCVCRMRSWPVDWIVCSSITLNCLSCVRDYDGR